MKIVGNLPFNVGTALMLKWLRMIPERKGPFVYGMHIKTKREGGERRGRRGDEKETTTNCFIGRVPMVLMFQHELAEVCPPSTPTSVTS